MRNAAKETFSRNNNDFMYKEIEDTFFKKSVPRQAPQKPKPKNPKRIRFFLISAVALGLALSTIIIILNKNRAKANLNIESGQFRQNIVKNGQLNRFDIEDVYFDGDAEPQSSFLESHIKLVNSGKYGWAAFVMLFDDPLDLDGKSLLIAAKTAHGTKNINLILKDTEGRFYKFPGIAFRPDWNLKHVLFDRNEDFDFTKIKQMKIEFGSVTAENAENTTIYIKDIFVRNAHEVKP